MLHYVSRVRRANTQHRRAQPGGDGGVRTTKPPMKEEKKKNSAGHAQAGALAWWSLRVRDEYESNLSHYWTLP